MDPARWQQLSPLLDELFELDTAARTARLQTLRAGDAALADELETLIALDEAQEDFLSEPVIGHHHGVLPGSQVGPYRLEHLLGEGGMGQVWLASRADGLYQRRVGLKLLRPGLADTNLRLRFTRERQILARLAHPHIARLLDAGISGDGLPYLALEYVDGAPITDYCRDRNTSLADRLRMFEQICAAVSHAHANLIIHRDLKPSNILVTPAGDVRLLDFGIAKLLDSDIAPERTRTGMRAFTLHYAAPEQVRGEPVSTMTDVYSLGVVLYELLTDAKPYRPKRDSDAAWEEAILQHDPAKPSQTLLLQNGSAARSRHDIAALRRRARTLVGDLDNIVLRTLSKRPEQRYPSVEALTQDLLRYATGRPVHARAQSWTYRLRKFLGRYRWPLATATLTTLVLSAALVIVAWQAREAVSEAARAQAMQAFMIGVFEGAGGNRDGEPMNLRDLLSTSVDRGRRELARQPRALAEVLGVVARLRTGLGDYSAAQALLTEQAGLIQVSADAPASLRLESLTQRGRIARLLGDPAACIALMQPALERARHEQAQLPPQVTEFYSQLGRCRRAHGDRQSARQLFERSLALRREGDNPVAVIENLIDLAGLRADANETSAALEQFLAARDQLQRDAGDQHPLLIEIHRNLGQLHRAQGQLDPAAQEMGTALALAREVHGSQHATTLAVQRQFTALQIEQGLYTEAIIDLRESHRLLSNRFGPDDAALADSYRALGLLQWERGDTHAALGALQHVVRIRRDGAQPAATADALIDLASVLHASGQDAAAHPLLLEVRALGKTNPAYPRADEASRLLGEIEIAQGRREEGALHLQHAWEQSRRQHGDHDPKTRRAELALAYYQANHLAGQPLAIAGLSKLDLLGALPESIELRETTWHARAYAAQLRCHGPRRLEAVQQLQLLDATLQQARPEGGAVRREVDAIRAGCNVPGVGSHSLAAD